MYGGFLCLADAGGDGLGQCERKMRLAGANASSAWTTPHGIILASLEK